MAEVETKGKKKKLIDSWLARVIGFLLLAVCTSVASVSIFCCGLAVTENFYGTGTVQDAMVVIGEKAYEDAAMTMWEYIKRLDKDGAIRYFKSKNIDVSILHSTAAPAGRERTRDVIFGTYDGSYEPFMTRDIHYSPEESIHWITDDGQHRYIIKNSDYIFRVYVDFTFPYHDSLRLLSAVMDLIYDMRYVCIVTALAGCIGVILCFIFLIRSARYGKGDTSFQMEKTRTTKLDLIFAFFLLGLIGILLAAVQVISVLLSRDLVLEMLAAAIFVVMVVIWITLFCYYLARQIKYEKWWKHTLIYDTMRFCFRLLKRLASAFVELLRGIPLVMTTVIVYLAVCVLEYFGGVLFWKAGIDMLWLIEKIILFPVVIYVALCCKRFLAASKALAEGQLDHTVNTSGMIGEMKKHGENLNSIGLGITRAVEERTKSERMKTELITNVSHDLKTPLTSIINYSRLISEQKTENKEIEEYSQVLFRQSERLKKLLEDLMEAAKATTGNLEVNLAPCEVGVLLSQAVGEYQQRLEEKELELHITQPEDPVRIIADGKHLWRVFDNLLNNIYKYAHENSRVYLNVEQQEGEVRIIFRNMSKYALNVSAEELGERFVRGDKSRHMEGNGLGLSIAKSLLELQHGTMQILIDGDLFKVILSFKQLEE